jgi:hypothetical protein
MSSFNWQTEKTVPKALFISFVLLEKGTLMITTAFYTFSNARKPLFKAPKPLPKHLRNSFPGVGYTAVAFGLGNGFCTFSHEK